MHTRIAAPSAISRPSRGFTMIEVLVVISIIALLVALLLPTLSKVRKSGQQVACLSNQRQIGISLNTYLQDHKETFMLIFDGAPTYRSWYVHLTKNGRNSVAYGYLESPAAMFCPSYEIPPSGDPTLNDMQYALFYGAVSYGMSYGLERLVMAPGQPVRPARLSEILDPSHTITTADALTDVPDKGCYWLTPYYSAGPGFGQGMPSLRHFSGSNILWVDGHVSFIRSPRLDNIQSMYDPEAMTSTNDLNNYWDRE